MQAETVEQFLARGGAIKRCPPAGGGSLTHIGTIVRVYGAGCLIKDDAGGAVVILGMQHWLRADRPKKGDRVVFDVSVGFGGKKYAIAARPA